VVGASKNAAVAAVAQVVPSRILMATPTMFIPPLIMSKLEKTATFIKNPWLKAPTAVLLAGICLATSTPLGCAIFPQKAAIKVAHLEPELQQLCAVKYPEHKQFYFNKGL
jgi:hypothetical protein